MQSDSPAKTDRSIGELFAELTKEVIDLVRKEFTLAKVELGQKASEAGKQVGAIAVGGALGFSGLLVLLAAVVLLLATVGVPAWLSALIVGLVVVGIAAFLVKKGLDGLRKVDFAPRQTIETIKDTTK